MEQSETDYDPYDRSKLVDHSLDDAIELLKCKKRADDILSKQYDELQTSARVPRASGRRGSDSTQFMQESLLFRDAVSLCRAIFDDKTFYEYDTTLITIKREDISDNKEVIPF